MSLVRRILSALNIFGARRKRKKADDASIYPLF